MNYTRMMLAALGAFVAYFVFGGLWTAIPLVRNEFRNYPNVYRSKEGIMSVMPLGITAMFVAIFALTVVFALLGHHGSSLVEGARFGALIGVFAVGSFVIHNYVNLNIGLKLTIQQGVAYFLQWVIVGLVIGAIYRPIAPQ
jgi:hypothetical protein